MRLIIAILMPFMFAATARAQNDSISGDKYNQLISELNAAWNAHNALVPKFNLTVERHNRLLAEKNSIVREVEPLIVKYRAAKMWMRDSFRLSHYGEPLLPPNRAKVVPYIEGCFFDKRRMLYSKPNYRKANSHTAYKDIYYQALLMENKIYRENEEMAKIYKEMVSNIAEWTRKIPLLRELLAETKAKLRKYEEAIKALKANRHIGVFRSCCKAVYCNYGDVPLNYTPFPQEPASEDDNS